MPNKEKRIENLKKANEESHSLIVESLKSALYELLETKEISAIKVVDLTKKAGVSRGGFYRRDQGDAREKPDTDKLHVGIENDDKPEQKRECSADGVQIPQRTLRPQGVGHFLQLPDSEQHLKETVQHGEKRKRAVRRTGNREISMVKRFGERRGFFVTA